MPAQGLAYSVSGGFNTTTVDHRGLFIAGGETAAAGDFILALERVLKVILSNSKFAVRISVHVKAMLTSTCNLLAF